VSTLPLHPQQAKKKGTGGSRDINAAVHAALASGPAGPAGATAERLHGVDDGTDVIISMDSGGAGSGPNTELKSRGSSRSTSRRGSPGEEAGLLTPQYMLDGRAVEVPLEPLSPLHERDE
jgi:hypothetical protein